MEELYSKYYIFRTSFSNISVIFLSNAILLYSIKKLFPTSGTNLIFPQLEMQKLYSKYYIFCTYFSNISVVSLSNDILLYTVGKLFLIPIQWCYSHVPIIKNAKVIFKIHHFIVFNSLTFVSTRAPTQI